MNVTFSATESSRLFSTSIAFSKSTGTQIQSNSRFLSFNDLKQTRKRPSMIEERNDIRQEKEFFNITSSLFLYSFILKKKSRLFMNQINHKYNLFLTQFKISKRAAIVESGLEVTKNHQLMEAETGNVVGGKKQ